MTLEQFAETLQFDLDKALDRVVNNRALYTRLINVFVDDSYMNQARQAVADKDYRGIEQAVHTMKGSGANLEFLAMSEACHNTVAAIRNQEYDKVEGLFDKVEEEYSRIKNAVMMLD